MGPLEAQPRLSTWRPGASHQPGPVSVSPRGVDRLAMAPRSCASASAGIVRLPGQSVLRQLCEGEQRRRWPWSWRGFVTNTCSVLPSPVSCHPGVVLKVVWGLCHAALGASAAASPTSLPPAVEEGAGASSLFGRVLGPQGEANAASSGWCQATSGRTRPGGRILDRHRDG